MFLRGIPSYRCSLKINTQRSWCWAPRSPPDLTIRTAQCHLFVKCSQAQDAGPSRTPTAKQMEQKLPQAACPPPWLGSAKSQAHTTQAHTTQAHTRLLPVLISQFLLSGNNSKHSFMLPLRPPGKSSPGIKPHPPQPWPSAHTDPIITKV